MTRMIAIVLVILSIAFCLTGCSGKDNTNVSTTPNGTVNGNNDTTEIGPGLEPKPATGSSVQGNDFQDAVTTPAHPAQDNYSNDVTTPDAIPNDTPMENFGNDMKDAASDIMDGARNAMDDVTGSRSRSRTSGTGMVGGR